MKTFLKSTVSLSFLTVFLLSGLLQAQENLDKEVRIKIRKQEGDKVIEIDKTFNADEEVNISEWLEEMGLDSEFLSEELDLDIDVINGDVILNENSNPGIYKEKIIIKSEDGEEEEIVIIKDENGLSDFEGRKELMQAQIIERIETLKEEMSAEQFEELKDYFESQNQSGTLGVMIKSTEESPGVFIEEVMPGSAAEKAGLQANDQILSIAGENVATYGAVIERLSNHGVGETVEVVVKRNEETVVAAATLQGSQKRMMFFGNENAREHFGMGSRAHCAQEKSFACGPAKKKNSNKAYLGVTIEDSPEGVKVVSIASGSGASESRMDAGHIIKSINGDKTPDYDALLAALKDKEPGEKVKVKFIDANGKTWKQKITLGERPMGFSSATKGCCPEAESCCPGQSNVRNFETSPGKVVEIESEGDAEEMKIFIYQLDQTGDQKRDVQIIVSELREDEAQVLEEAKNSAEGLNLLELNDLVFYPNPSNGNINVSFKGPKSDYTIRVLDMRGNEVYSNNTGNVSSFDGNVDISNSPDGAYIIQIFDEEKILKRKVIVK